MTLRKHRLLNTIVAQLKHGSFQFNKTIVLKIVKTTNNNQNKQNKIKVSTLKSVPKYHSRVLVVSRFCFAHLLNTSFFTYATIAFSERYSVM